MDLSLHKGSIRNNVLQILKANAEHAHGPLLRGRYNDILKSLRRKQSKQSCLSELGIGCKASENILAASKQ